jgi:hypothetical protein
LHENTPLFLVPDDGAAEPHDAVWVLLPAGALSWHDAKATPDLASVSVMLHATVCAAAETLTAFGDNESDVSAGDTRSGSDVIVNIEGNPNVPGSMGPGLVFPTASGAVTPAVQTPDCEYRGNVMTHDHVPFCGVPDVGAAALQLCR